MATVNTLQPATESDQGSWNPHVANPPQDVEAEIRGRIADGYLPIVTGIGWVKGATGLRMSCTDAERVMILRGFTGFTEQDINGEKRLIVQIAPSG